MAAYERPAAGVVQGAVVQDEVLVEGDEDGAGHALRGWANSVLMAVGGRFSKSRE